VKNIEEEIKRIWGNGEDERVTLEILERGSASLIRTGIDQNPLGGSFSPIFSEGEDVLIEDKP